MIKLIIRADDIGYCDGVNRGIKDAVETGLVKSAGLMPNMNEAVNGFEMLKGKDICIGQHTNLCLGVPCCDPKDIPSLVNENGELKSSSQFRNAFKDGVDLITLEDAVLEIEAQYRRFKEIVAEGVETKEEADLLTKWGISLIVCTLLKRFRRSKSSLPSMPTACGGPLSFSCSLRLAFSCKSIFFSYSSSSSLRSKTRSASSLYTCTIEESLTNSLTVPP